MVGKLVERWIAEVGVWRCLYDPDSLRHALCGFAMAVGTGSCYLVFALCLHCDYPNFFMQLGISVGRLMGRKWRSECKPFPVVMHHNRVALCISVCSTSDASILSSGCMMWTSRAKRRNAVLLSRVRGGLYNH